MSLPNVVARTSSGKLSQSTGVSRLLTPGAFSGSLIRSPEAFAVLIIKRQAFRRPAEYNFVLDPALPLPFPRKVEFAVTENNPMPPFVTALVSLDLSLVAKKHRGFDIGQTHTDTR